jgi:hypothetical protein
MKLIWAGLAIFALHALGQTAGLSILNSNRPILDAHNCYPYEGRWADRLDRALASGFPIGIEQDLAWFDGSVVVSHTPKTTGQEPTLREHFFEKVRPLVERKLADGDRSRWPVIVLHFDFKDNQPALMHAVWSLLGEYEAWVTTAPKTGNPLDLAPFRVGPILVLTEDNDAQEQVFFEEIPAGGRLRLFGSAHTTGIDSSDPRERARLAATLPPETLLAERPTNYRRWWNNSWYGVEEGGQPNAGEWTEADAARLRALVNHAHRLGFWIRFYTLDGFSAAEDQGWDQGYNFGSRQGAEIRWRAAIDAGVNLIATDQYEGLAGLLSPRR